MRHDSIRNAEVNNELNEWLSQRMANRQLVEDVRVSLREIRNNQGVGHYSLNDLARDDPRLVDFICARRCSHIRRQPA